MNLGRLFLFLTFFSLPVVAQTDIETALKKSNPNIIYQDEAQNFNGEALVYLEGVSDQPRPKNWKEKLNLRLFGSIKPNQKDLAPELELTPFVAEEENDGSIEIQPAFGNKMKVANISHTADWRFIITTTDTDSINIQEDLVVLLSEEKDNLVRDWPMAKKHFHLTQAVIDNQEYFPSNEEGTSKTSFNFPKLTPGVHKIHFNYILSLPQTEKAVQLPLIGEKWPLLANTFSGIVFANNNQISKPKFLIGLNEKEFPENFSYQEDTKGNLFFRMNKIFPANTPFKLQTTVENNLKTGIFNSSAEIWVFIISITTILLYILLSAIEVKHMKLEKKLKRFHKIALTPLKRWFLRCGEITLGTFLLLTLTFLFCYFVKINLGILLGQILILISILAIFTADFLAFYPVQKQIYQMHNNKERIS